MYKTTTGSTPLYLNSLLQTWGSNKDGRDVFLNRFLKIAKDSAAWIELGRSLHQVGTVNEKVCESDFVPLWDGTIN